MIFFWKKVWLRFFAGMSLLFLSFTMATPAAAFFENQARYAFEHRWLPMLSDESPEKRFQAMRAFFGLSGVGFACPA